VGSQPAILFVIFTVFYDCEQIITLRGLECYENETMVRLFHGEPDCSHVIILFELCMMVSAGSSETNSPNMMTMCWRQHLGSTYYYVHL
jgi:hypothetical protein